MRLDCHHELHDCRHGTIQELYKKKVTTHSLIIIPHACSLPRVQPHYAVKCNPNAAILATLAAAGASFDCASQHEMQLVLSMGVSPDHIIFAHPCKVQSNSRCLS